MQAKARRCERKRVDPMRDGGARPEAGLGVDWCCATRYTPCMASFKNRSAEVGRYIRRQVIPQGMSVTEAARRLGVGRPALSNLLNGRAALSQKMALRLEATFGADQTQLLELQAASDRDRRRAEDRAVPVGAYVPDFLTIKARQIADWASNIQSRERLPVFLRHLIHATGRELSEVDFPGYDNAQRHGWDGWVVAGAAAPWVPEGRSGWELSVEQRPREKADHDYRMRRNKVSPAERAELTFVFVTPHNWEGKTRWAWGKQDAGEWKAVRAFDASDLEQWLETTISPRIWLAQELDLSTEGFETLDSFWNRWAKASDPPMTASIFAPSIAAHLSAFKKWLKAPSDRPFRVTADSREEAVAFLACLLRHEDAPAAALGRAVVFESASTLRTLAQSSSPFIPIVYDEECEREIAAAYRQRHCIVVRPRNAVDREPDLAVELLDHAAFEKALTDMGIGAERVHRLARESGRSPTVLRRRRSQIEAIKTPPWAGDEEVARRLMPMALVGAWHCGSKADREVLAALADCDYDEVEAVIASLLRYDDSPVWCIDQYRGVVSKIDALFAISPLMTTKDVDDFLACAKYVLSESDPALKLPEDQRWAAGLYGKVRQHSRALRIGVCETLVLLAVHGNDLFRERLGIDVAARVVDLVKSLLTPLTSDKLRSHDKDLPGYAEVAPDQFVALLEEDLGRPKPALLSLLTPTDAGLFSHPARTGVLWALERLAWNPQTFPRVVHILARFSQTEINDNWFNKPINSLSAVFRSWLPQTAASLDDRIKALEALCACCPDVGWKICLQQFEVVSQVGSFCDRPRWRNDASGAGRGVSTKEQHEFARKALDIALAWPVHDETTLGDLVERFENMADKDRSSIWKLIDDWSRSEENEKAREKLRERIRGRVLLRCRALGLNDQIERARQACENLASSDPVVRHAWLFAAEWVEIFGYEESERRLNWKEEEERLHELRTAAMAEIWSSNGFDGAFALLANCDACTVGRYAACCEVDQHVVADVIRTCLADKASPAEKMDNFVRGLLCSVDENTRAGLISTFSASVVDQRVRLFTCAPFSSQTWHLLDQENRRVKDGYWRAAIPVRARFTESETTEVIDRLLEVKRPQAAFHAVRFDWTKVETSRLKRLLTDFANVWTEPDDYPECYRLSKALDSLGSRPGVTVDEMAQLEFEYIEALTRNDLGIPNIERMTRESPAFFVYVLALFCGRSDGGQDPPEWRIDDSDQTRYRVPAALRLLQHITRVAGVSAEGDVDADTLSQWVTEVRRLCAEHGRVDSGDQQIGRLLARVPFEEDGSWPCRAICEVLESIASEDVASGFGMEVINARGVVSRARNEGGDQERSLSAKYRTWSERWAFDYPHVAGVLRDIARYYDRDAEREDSRVRAWNRLHY